jgi:hypothetical protein
MNCSDFERDVQALLDDRRTDLPPRLRGHAADCADCRTLWEGLLVMLAAVRFQKAAAPPSTLVSSILAELARDGRPVVSASPDLSVPPSPPEPLAPAQLNECKPVRLSGQDRCRTPAPGQHVQGQAWWTLWSTAAVLLLAAIALRGIPNVEPNSLQVAGIPQTPPVDSPPAAEPAPITQSLAGLWQGMRVEYRDLSHEAVRLLDNLAEFPEADAPADATAPAASLRPEPSSWWRVHHPVSERVGQAFDFLKDALPERTPQSS